MKSINLAKPVLICLSLFVASNTWAESNSYQTQVNLSHIGRTNSTTNYVGGEYFFTPVSTKAHPLAEANFFSRSSSVSGLFAKTDQDSSSVNFDTNAASVLYNHLNKNSPLTFSIGYSKSDSAITGSGASGSADSTSHSLDVGYYLTNNSLLKFGYLNSDGTYSHPSISNTTSKLTAYLLQYKQIIEFSDNTALGITALAFTGESSTDVSTATDYSIYDITADYYFNRAFSLSGSLASRSSDSASLDGMEYGLGIGYFITESFQVTASFRNFDSTADSAKDTDDLYINANYRF